MGYKWGASHEGMTKKELLAYIEQMHAEYDKMRQEDGDTIERLEVDLAEAIEQRDAFEKEQLAEHRETKLQLETAKYVQEALSFYILALRRKEARRD